MRVSDLVRWVIVGVVLAMNPHIADAGGGPETTLIVVNADSPLSMRIANTYATIRDIPQSHLVWLHGVPSLGVISVATYRKRIWGPIRNYLSKHGESVNGPIYLETLNPFNAEHDKLAWSDPDSSNEWSDVTSQ